MNNLEINSVDDSLLDIVKYLLSAYHKQLFDIALFYNYVLLVNNNLSVEAYHVNHNSMLSKIKLYNGLNFNEENMGRTSISEAYKTNKISIEYPLKCNNPLFKSYTNCTVPIITENKTIGYLAIFFLSSKYDELSANYFILFSKYIMSNFKYHSMKSKVEGYINKTMRPNFKTSGLSDSEKRVLNLLKKGYSNKEISNRLFISENTIKSHVQLISDKLSCENRTQIAVNTLLFEIQNYFSL